ncbi:MAG: spore coat protein [Peptococcaceae bacterium]|jgi:similar to spore coat protein|nr:spore coat protein [Peptococcaceae bacterium]
MANIIQDVAGVDFMTEKDIVIELLLTSKNTVNRYAAVLSEATSPMVRDVLKKHLNQNIDLQGQIVSYAMAQGYYRPYNPSEQINDDLKKADTSLDLEAWKLQAGEEFFGSKRDTPIVRS